MPEVNTQNDDMWEKRRNFILAYRKKIITREEFCILWKACSIAEYGFKEGAE